MSRNRVAPPRPARTSSSEGPVDQRVGASAEEDDVIAWSRPNKLRRSMQNLKQGDGRERATTGLNGLRCKSSVSVLAPYLLLQMVRKAQRLDCVMHRCTYRRISSLEMFDRRM
ncbi:transcription factor [Pseudozyma hubeiensis SY62]|uniref:Transcription factor n=1 Tax=Pseudozyma hubeiensis (strain SY62) TaxID=1305764 RepID=R9PFB9_PSEHS|nr:transcription factor [Pseudozyma hubeiensis SY62]GAC96775.1 transcription factor [Pseudozyma hubeiensis SY62]